MSHEGISLEGRVALVTGGGAGLGRGIVEAFAGLGARVVVAERDEARAADVRAWLSERGPDHLVCDVDVVDAAGVRDMVARVEERLGRLDILVNNVGDFCNRMGPFRKSTEDDWQVFYEANLLHVFRVTHAALPLIRQGGRGGSIINVSTIEAFRGIPNGAVYSAFNAGVTGFTKSLAVELGRERIRVNAIAPETSDTEQVRPREWVAPQYRDHVDSWVPLGRFGQPSDAAGCAVFLASDLSSWVTGTTILLDGGSLAAGGWTRVHETGRWTNTPVVSDSGI